MQDVMRRIKSFIQKVLIKVTEKEYVLEGGRKIRYLFFPGIDKSHLCIVFSAFGARDVKGQYNYIRSLRSIKCAKLYILDDFGYNQVGSYYLGDHCFLYEQKAVQQLIEKISGKLGKPKSIFAGSSKGGSAALLYGCEMGADYIIAGSPQYHIGQYLCENEYHKKILLQICDEQHDIEWLDNLIKYAVEKTGDVKVHLLYSSKEESYNNHVGVRELVDSLQRRWPASEFCDRAFEDHANVGTYFTAYLRETISKIIGQQ